MGDDWLVAVNTAGIVTFGRSIEPERRFGKFKFIGEEGLACIGTSLGSRLEELNLLGDDSSLLLSGAGAFVPRSSR